MCRGVVWVGVCRWVRVGVHAVGWVVWVGVYGGMGVALGVWCGCEWAWVCMVVGGVCGREVCGWMRVSGCLWGGGGGGV